MSTRTWTVLCMCGAQLALATVGSAQMPAPPHMREAVPQLDDPRAHGEREYIRRPPVALPRPSVCRAELQAAIRVNGTVYNARDPDRSLALLSAPTAKKVGLYHCGSRWGYLRILEVRPHAVLVSTESDAPCWLRMTRPPPEARPKHAKAERRPRARRARTAFTSDELEQTIQSVGPGAYRVDRTLLDRALARASRIARSTRVRVIQAHGSPVGLKLRRIPAGGLFAHLGLKRGDVLKTVNGFQIASVDGMLSARTQLASAPRLSLALVRGGKPMTFEYRID